MSLLQRLNFFMSPLIFSFIFPFSNPRLLPFFFYHSSCKSYLLRLQLFHVGPVLFIPFLLDYILHVSILYIKAAGWWEPTLDPDTPAHLVSRWSGETYSFFLKLWRSQPDQGQYLMLISWKNTVSPIKLWKRKVYVAQFRCFMFIGIFKIIT